ncbi:MAG: N-acetylmuramic acid 6-phosphate etherase [Pseudobdellovibrionaceae bacterium]
MTIDLATLRSLKTEQHVADAKGMDMLSAKDLIKMLHHYQLEAVNAVEGALPEIVAVVREAAARLKDKSGRYMGAGAGTSYRLVVQDQIEMATLNWKKKRMGYFGAGGKDALVLSNEGGEDDIETPVRLIKDAQLGEHDVFLGVTASGRTPWVLAGTKQARQQGAMTVAIVNNEGSALSREAEYTIYLDTTPEPVGGSTRMNAGTSQKMTLNLISCGILFELGHLKPYDLVELLEDTPSFRPKFKSLEEMQTEDFLRCLLENHAQAIRGVAKSIPTMAKAAKDMADRLVDHEGDLVMGGAGTTARAAVQEGAELYPTFGFSPKRTHFALLGGKAALTRDFMLVVDQEDAAVEAAETFDINAKDVCILGSVSGRTRYTKFLAEEAMERGALTIGLSNLPNADLFNCVTHGIYLPTGANPMGKLTRYSAGTAHKVTLNMLTTAAMTMMGHVYNGMMVDVQPFCEKLVVRNRGIVQDITGCSEEEAKALLDATSTRAAGQNATRAVLLHGGVKADEWEVFLQKHGNRSNKAIRALGYE